MLKDYDINKKKGGKSLVFLLKCHVWCVFLFGWRLSSITYYSIFI